MTGTESVIYKEYSEYHTPPLAANFGLLQESDGIFIDGIGVIAQYHCYCDMMFTHNFIYYLRDKTMQELATATNTDIFMLKTRLQNLNSKISAYEQCQ